MKALIFATEKSAPTFTAAYKDWDELGELDPNSGCMQEGRGNTPDLFLFTRAVFITSCRVTLIEKYAPFLSHHKLSRILELGGNSVYDSTEDIRQDKLTFYSRHSLSNISVLHLAFCN